MNDDGRSPLDIAGTQPSEVLLDRSLAEGLSDEAEPYLDDHADATFRLMEMISAVEFLRRGDRRGLTLWSALEEALRWWSAERAALLDGVEESLLAAPRLGGGETLPTTLIQFVAIAGQDEPVHLHSALQQALRRWTATMASRHNEGRPWPPQLEVPTQLRLQLEPYASGPHPTS